MLRVMTIVGTRPEIIKMSRVIAALDDSFEHTLVHTGQNYDYELNQVFFDELRIRKPDHFLEVASSTVAQTIARVIERSDALFENIKPDALLIYGDTNSCLSVIAAKRRKIPVFHMEAGNRCFDQNVPEELNRKVVDHLSDINMVLTEHARRNLLAEGIRPDTIIKTGSHLPEVISYYSEQIKQSKVMEENNLKPKSFFLMSFHREETVDDHTSLMKVMASIEAIYRKYRCLIVVSTHPRTKKRLEAAGVSIPEGVLFTKPFGFFDYLTLQKNARCVVSDSGTLTEEASILGFTAIAMRNVHERPEGFDAGVLIMSGLEPEMVLNSIEIAISNGPLTSGNPDYPDVCVSRTVVHTVMSYVAYVNRKIWAKSL